MALITHLGMLPKVHLQQIGTVQKQPILEGKFSKTGSNLKCAGIAQADKNLLLIHLRFTI